MNKNIRLFIVTLASSLLLTGSSIAQQPTNPKDPDTHFLQSKFNLTVGQSKTFILPRKDCPVKIEASITGIVENNVSSAPILLIGWAVRDSRSGKTRGKSFLSPSARQDCSFNDPPAGLLDCGFSNGEKVLAQLILDPNTGNLVITLIANPGGGLDTNELPVCVNMWF